MIGEKCWRCNEDLEEREEGERCKSCGTEFICSCCGNPLENINASLCEGCDIEVLI